MLFGKVESMDLHLSSRQIENISPLKILQYADLKIFLLFLVGPRRASLGRGKKGEEGQGTWGQERKE